MAYELLLDEHCERRIGTLLNKMGHDAVMVVDVDRLGPGSSDDEIAAYAKRTSRLVLTSDDDFLVEIAQGEHAGVLLITDDRLSAHRVATIVDKMSDAMAQTQISSEAYVSENWL